MINCCICEIADVALMKTMTCCNQELCTSCFERIIIKCCPFCRSPKDFSLSNRFNIPDHLRPGLLLGIADAMSVVKHEMINAMYVRAGLSSHTGITFFGNH